MRWAAWSSLLAVALVALVLIAGRFWLGTASGGRKLRDTILAQVNGSICGRLEIDDLRLAGDGLLVVTGVRLYDPSGALVGGVGRLEAKAALMALLVKRVHLERVDAREVELLLEIGPAGLSLARALEPRGPVASSLFGWDIGADALQINGVHVALRLSPQAVPYAEVSGGEIRGSGRVRRGGSSVDLRASGELAGPITGPLSAHVAATSGSAATFFEPVTIEDVDVSAGASRLRLRGRVEQGALSVNLDKLSLARQDVRHVVPEMPLSGDISATGTAGVDATGAHTTLRLPAGAGNLEVEAAVAFSPLKASGSLKLDEADLSALLSMAPATKVDGAVSASFAEGEPAPGNGEVTLQLGPSLVRGVRIESATGRVELRGHEVMPAVAVVLPGGRVTLEGSASEERLDLRAQVVMSALDAFAAAVAALSGIDAPSAQGAGSLSVHATGKPWAPNVSFAGTFAGLQAGALSLQGVALDGELPNATRPYVFRAKVRVDKGAVSELPFANLDATVDANRRAFSVDLATAGQAGVKTHLAGEIDPDQRGGLVSELTLSTAGTRWTLAQPTTVDLRRGIQVARLELHAGGQSIEASGGITQGQLSLQVKASRLDLAQLSKPLSLERLGLAGRADLAARISGTARHLEGSAKARVAGLAALGLKDVDATAALTLTAQRASGRLDADQHGAHLHVAFDGPFPLSRAPARSPLSATVELTGLGLKELGDVLDREDLAQGEVALHAELSGTADDPRLAARLRLTAARWGRYPAVNLLLTADAGERTRVEAKLDLADGPITLAASSATSLRAWLARPALETLRTLPLQATLDAPKLALTTFATLLPAGTTGTAKLSATIAGSVARPRGSVRLDLADVTLGTLRGLALTAKLEATDVATKLTAHAQVAGESLALLDAGLDAPIERLRSLEELSVAGAHAQLVSGPVNLRSIFPAVDDSPPARATLDLNATLRGSLGAPELTWTASARDVSTADQRLGELAAHGNYSDSKATTSVTIAGDKGGDTTLEAALRADLGLRSLAGSVNWALAPVEVSLVARDLDLRALAGLTRAVRLPTGRLSAHASLKGTLAAPVVRGGLAVHDGGLAIPGWGSYHNIMLDLSIDDRAFELQRLTAEAGGGSLRVSAKGERGSADQPYRLTAQLALDHLPVFVDSQRVATATAETSTVKGELQGSHASIEVPMTYFRLDLQQVSDKTLQPLQPNADITIHGKGAPAQARNETGSGLSIPWDLRLHVFAPRNLFVESSDLKAEASADLSVRVGDGPPRVTGKIVSREGRVEAMGRKFKLTRGEVSWNSEPVDDPRLDMKALWNNTQEQVKVFVRVTGTARKPQIELSSEPPLDDAQIASLIATGRRETRLGATAATGGASPSVLTNTAAEKLRRTIATALPLDVLRVDVGENGFQSTHVEAGTHLFEKFYLGYRRTFGSQIGRDENTNEVRAEYQVSPHLNLESEYGDANSGGVSVFYVRDY